MLERMKTKNFYILVLFIAITSIAVWLASSPATPNLKNIVKETHKQISNLRKVKLKEEKTLIVDDKYMDVLGFNVTPRTIFDQESQRRSQVPILATAVSSKNFDNVITFFLKSVNTYLKQKLKVILFDMGLDSSDLKKLKLSCNITTSCRVRKFYLDEFPSHISNWDTKAYKPLAIQILLQEYGSVFWSDTNEYFISGGIERVLETAQRSGLAAWTIQPPTSAFTHPKMFGFFNKKPELYFFHRMVKTDHLVIYNTKKIRDKVMFPWVQCALLEECISPTGSQRSGCRLGYKPRHKYSGCHKYEMSCFNIVLGMSFTNITDYAVNDVIFGDLKIYTNLTFTQSYSPKPRLKINSSKNI